MLVGLGYDIHQLKEGIELVLGGVKIPHSKGLFGHSDGDVLTHSICDAILGAMGEEDIGEHFPPDDPKYKNIYSIKLLKEVVEIMQDKELSINNLDITIIAQEPKISPHKKEIKQKIISILQIPENKVSIKATSPEKLDALGSGEGIACVSIVSLIEKK
jgi:2-C-methyl-D-erythritol 2,4-cyclodiphosphate synthase